MDGEHLTIDFDYAGRKKLWRLCEKRLNHDQSPNSHSSGVLKSASHYSRGQGGVFDWGQSQWQSLNPPIMVIEDHSETAQTALLSVVLQKTVDVVMLVPNTKVGWCARIHESPQIWRL